jgi:CheY-like chemotaxis protein
MLEHDEDDRYITQSFFEDNKFDVTLTFVSDSKDLQAYLDGVKKGSTPAPSLILLNYLAFPLNGLKILQDLKRDPALKHIPVVVLSGTVQKDLIRQCYQEGASSFIQKPSVSRDVDRKITNFFKYWFQTVELT